MGHGLWLAPVPLGHLDPHHPVEFSAHFVFMARIIPMAEWVALQGGRYLASGQGAKRANSGT